MPMPCESVVASAAPLRPKPNVKMKRGSSPMLQNVPMTIETMRLIIFPWPWRIPERTEVKKMNTPQGIR